VSDQALLNRPVNDQPPPLGFAELAARHGLTVSGARLPLGTYIRQLWGRRHFITAFSTAKVSAQYTQARLGQLWQVMTPLLNAAVYYFIFGVLLGTSKGIDDYIPYLVTGVFVWTYTQSSVLAGVRAVAGNIGLVRALHFPRASLPIAVTLIQFQQLLMSMGVLFAINLMAGMVPGPSWLLAIPALILQSLFNAGMALVMARLGSKMEDLAQLMPFILRTWMYVSGIMWSLTRLTGRVPHVVEVALELNPAAVYIDLMRYALIDSFTAAQLPHHIWPVAVVWAVVASVGGFVFFWRAEEEYGRG
jgi:teichoic acid transport system permease protein